MKKKGMNIVLSAAALPLSVRLVLGQAASAPAQRLEAAAALAESAASAARGGDLETAYSHMGAAMGSGAAGTRAPEAVAPSAVLTPPSGSSSAGRPEESRRVPEPAKGPLLSERAKTDVIVYSILALITAGLYAAGGIGFVFGGYAVAAAATFLALALGFK